MRRRVVTAAAVHFELTSFPLAARPRSCRVIGSGPETPEEGLGPIFSKEAKSQRSKCLVLYRESPVGVVAAAAAIANAVRYRLEGITFTGT